MPPRSRKPDPLSETPFWRTRGFVFGMIGLGVLLAIGGTAWLVKMNNRQQMQWRLDQDPQLAKQKQSLIRQINTAKPGQPRAPVALWLGRVKKFTIGQQTGANAAISLLDLDQATLLAGSRGAKDGTESLTISATHYTWGGPHPRAGEIWMVSVWREGDTNALHTAVRTSLK